MTNFLKWLRRENQWMRKLRLSKGLHNAYLHGRGGGASPASLLCWMLGFLSLGLSPGLL
jgi:hypothetical protein